MSTDSDVDTALTLWAERTFNGGPVKRTKSRRGMTGLKLTGQGARMPTQQPTAASARRQLSAIVKRSPQVLVRVSGGGRTIGHIKAHLDYITRNGQITLEDQAGEKIGGRDGLEDLRDEWQFGGIPISEGSTARQAFNIVLSMPAGTDADAVLAAARSFAEEEFFNHQYAMALHTEDTDPDKDPSPNPHVHLCVKAMGLDGIRLNPRKEDLQRWRERFAEQLRSRGVDADATRRIHRFQRDRGEKQSVRYMKRRGEQLHSIGQAPVDAIRAVKAKAMESQALARYRQLTNALAGSQLPADRRLALGLARRLTGHDPQPSDRQPDKSVPPDRNVPDWTKE